MRAGGSFLTAITTAAFRVPRSSVIIKPQALEVRLVPTSEASFLTEEPGTKDLASQLPTPAITLAWTALRRRQGYRSCTFRKAGAEAREP
jgi:hypothetical protein